MSLFDGKPRDFFRNLLGEWLGRRHVSVSKKAHTYVTNVLTRSAFDQQASTHLLKEPLGLTYLQASVAAARLRLALLRQVGDNALLLAGWWREHLLDVRSGVDVNYYTQIGQMAYRGIPKPLFDELAQKFEALTDVLMRMELSCAPRTADEDVRLYGLWLRTGETALAEALTVRRFILSGNPNSRPS